MHYFPADGSRVYHSGRREYGTYRGVDQHDPARQTVWVEFDSGDEVMVSLVRLDPVCAHEISLYDGCLKCERVGAAVTG